MTPDDWHRLMDQAVSVGVEIVQFIGGVLAHEYRFHGLADRVRVIRLHHDHRTQEILDVLARPGPGWAGYRLAGD